MFIVITLFYRDKVSSEAIISHQYSKVSKSTKAYEKINVQNNIDKDSKKIISYVLFNPFNYSRSLKIDIVSIFIKTHYPLFLITSVTYFFQSCSSLVLDIMRHLTSWKYHIVILSHQTFREYNL